MTVRECYETIGENYTNAQHRLGDDNRIKRFLSLLLKDENYQKLIDAQKANDGKAAFAAAHTIKGVALNMDMSHLANAASKLTEALRESQPIAALGDLFQGVTEAYEAMRIAIEQLLSSAD